jgi:hypothetical protein
MGDELKKMENQLKKNKWIKPNFKLELIGPNQSLQRSQMKTTCIWRRPENTKCQVSQQPLVGSYSSFKLRLRGPNKSVQRSQMKTTCIGKQPLGSNLLCSIFVIRFIMGRKKFLGQNVWRLKQNVIGNASNLQSFLT